MKITKFEHSCLLVEMPDPVNRTALIDPGMMSTNAIPFDSLEFLDDIIITHEHGDHFSLDNIKQLVDKFPKVHLTTTESIVAQLAEEGIVASSEPSDGIVLFNSPHEIVEPIFPTPQQIGVHYLDLLTIPGDSLSFDETKAVLALPLTAPWGSIVASVTKALELGPKIVLPVHDWHYKDEARMQFYESLPPMFAEHDIQFLPLKSGEPVVLDI